MRTPFIKSYQGKGMKPDEALKFGAGPPTPKEIAALESHVARALTEPAFCTAQCSEESPADSPSRNQFKCECMEGW